MQKLEASPVFRNKLIHLTNNLSGTIIPYTISHTKNPYFTIQETPGLERVESRNRNEWNSYMDISETATL